MTHVYTLVCKGIDKKKKGKPILSKKIDIFEKRKYDIQIIDKL